MPEAALAALGRRACALPVVTLGERGAVFLWRDEVRARAGAGGEVVDTTGRGGRLRGRAALRR